MSLKDQLLTGPPAEPVEINGLTVYIKAPTLPEFFELQRRVMELPEPARESGSVVLAVLYCTHDEHGERVFGPDDTAAVERMPLEALVKINAAAATKMDFLGEAKKK